MSNLAEPQTNDPIALQAMLAAERAENERLRQIIKELQRHGFGRRADPSARPGDSDTCSEVLRIHAPYPAAWRCAFSAETALNKVGRIIFNKFD